MKVTDILRVKGNTLYTVHPDQPLLQATWQTLVPEAATNVPVRGVECLDANLQRGFVTVQSGGILSTMLLHNQFIRGTAFQ